MIPAATLLAELNVNGQATTCSGRGRSSAVAPWNQVPAASVETIDTSPPRAQHIRHLYGASCQRRPAHDEGERSAVHQTATPARSASPRTAAPLAPRARASSCRIVSRAIALRAVTCGTARRGSTMQGHRTPRSGQPTGLTDSIPATVNSRSAERRWHQAVSHRPKSCCGRISRTVTFPFLFR